MSRMTTLAWSAALSSVAFGVLLVVVPTVDVWLVRSGRVSITDAIRDASELHPWLYVVGPAAIFGGVNAVAGLAVGHIWLQ